MDCLSCGIEVENVCDSCNACYCNNCLPNHVCSNPRKTGIRDESLSTSDSEKDYEELTKVVGGVQQIKFIRDVPKLKAKNGEIAYRVYTKDRYGNEKVDIIFLREHIRNVNRNPKVQYIYGDRIYNIWRTLKTLYQFPNDETAMVFLATWFVRNGSVYMKGTPGSGKTTLVEMSVNMLANNIDFSRAPAKLDRDENGKIRIFLEPKEKKWYVQLDKKDFGYNKLTIDRFIKSDYGTFGITKHNLDKLPLEILYKTDIKIQKTAPGMINNPAHKLIINNPEGEDKVLEVQTYDFKPETRNIVNAPIKMNNESNRMSPAVQDAMLGLLAENQVEYLGRIFNSPRIGTGSITFFDSNPHIEIRIRNYLDPAFLDRIDVGMWFPSPPLVSRMLLSKMQDMGVGDLRNILAFLLNQNAEIEITEQEYNEILSKLKSVGAKPSDLGGLISTKPYRVKPAANMNVISYEELQEIWDDVEKIQIPDKISIYISAITSMFGFSFRTYYKTEGGGGSDYKSGHYINGVLGEKQIDVFIRNNFKTMFDLIDRQFSPDNEATKMQNKQAKKDFMDRLVNLGIWTRTANTFVDKSLIHYSPALKAMRPMPAMVVAGSINEFLEEVTIPLGDRSRQSMEKILKSYCWLKHIIDMNESPTRDKIVNTNPIGTTWEQQLDNVFTLLPYIVEHRIGRTSIAPEGMQGTGMESQPEQSLTAKKFLNYFDFVRYRLIPEGLARGFAINSTRDIISLMIDLKSLQILYPKNSFEYVDVWRNGSLKEKEKKKAKGRGGKEVEVEDNFNGRYARCPSCNKLVDLKQVKLDGITSCPNFIDDENGVSSRDICGTPFPTDGLEPIEISSFWKIIKSTIKRDVATTDYTAEVGKTLGECPLYPILNETAINLLTSISMKPLRPSKKEKA